MEFGILGRDATVDCVRTFILEGLRAWAKWLRRPLCIPPKGPCHCGEVRILSNGLSCSMRTKGEYVVVTKLHGAQRCVSTGYGEDELSMESFKLGKEVWNG